MTALSIQLPHVPRVEGVFSQDDVARAASGDVAAFERLYRSHVPRIHSLARRMAGAREAEELTQDVFVRAWMKLASFRGESAFSTWLHRLAVNVIIEKFRSRQSERSRWIEDSSVLELMPVKPGSHGVRLDLEAALDMVPKGARAVFVLHDVEGHTHQEIGEILGVTAGTSKAQLHRARMILRRHLE